MKSAILCIVICASIGAVSLSARADVVSSMPPDKVAELTKSIRDDMTKSDKWVSWNQRLDIAARIVVFLLAAAAAVGAAKAASLGSDPVPPWLKMTNAALTSITTLVTAVAFTQFDFAKRQAIWERRYHALEACEATLKFRNPDLDAFNEQLELIRRWGDSSSLSELNATCNSASTRAKSSTNEATQPEPKQAPTSPKGDSSKTTGT